MRITVAMGELGDPATGLADDQIPQEGEMSMTAVAELVRSMGDRLQISASARTVYGDPVIVGGRTVIPVARVGYGFGAGGNRGEESAPNAGRGRLGGGAGMRASPVGALEISDAGTRFIRFIDPVRLAITLGLAVVLGIAIGRRSLRWSRPLGN